MRFSLQQDRALCTAACWLRAGGAQVFRLFGYAGTGKTRRYNKNEAWLCRCEAFTKVSAHIAALIGAREGAAVIPLRG